MNTALPKDQLQEVLDRITREVTRESVGIQLAQGESSPGEDLCTVHIGFSQGFHSTLSLRADTAMLTRLTQSFIQEENVIPQDVEDVAKEYFNVLCGQISSALFQATKIASRFTVPAFQQGSFSPEDYQEQFVLSYADENNGSAQLVHFVPVTGEQPETGDTTQTNEEKRR
ncbi:hypothetical protein D1646_18115 [Pseudoflavonifractor sp. 60]|uniref:chemotaxis protein CheX n=1 Tax=Pseudoflavonifractor sp. 60 TaxID=2304576 RepID=UPI00136AF9F6|nr:chemotaxis protein CheX [Pseudoflavonifractor sp. 60]NBI68662.1 hypothetical protein [Pseudoflavonifractor sp. 60]